MNILLDDTSNIIYNNSIVTNIIYNDTSIWENPIPDNYYVMAAPFLRTFVSNMYAIPEYNSHTLVLPEKTNDDILKLHFNYDSHGYHDNIAYTNLLANVIRCDDDCFGIIIDHAGSAGSGNNKKGYHITVDDNSTLLYNETLNEIWYRATAEPSLEGCYSSKIYHVPSNSYTFDITLGKYGSFIASELSDWEEHGKEMEFNKLAYHSTYEDYMRYHNMEDFSALYTNPVNVDYYYSLINELILWVNDTSANYQDRCLFYTENIVDKVTANNEVYKQTLTCTTKENEDNMIKYQCLLYTADTDPDKPRGYQPSIYKPSYIAHSPRIIIILDPKKDKLIYWGAEATSRSSNGPGVWSSILYKDYTDISLQTLSELKVNFNGLSFARLSTIKRMNNTLYDRNKDRKYIQYCFGYVAIPDIYYNKVIPHFWDLNNVEITEINSLISDNYPYKCEFAGLKYYLYSVISTYRNVTTDEYKGYVYDYTTLTVYDGQLITKITVDIN